MLRHQAPGRIRFPGHRLQYVEELLALADEESICNEAFDRRHRPPNFIGRQGRTRVRPCRPIVFLVDGNGYRRGMAD